MRWLLLHLPLEGGAIGGLRPPFLALRTPMRSIGYPRSGREGVNRAAIKITPPRIAHGDPTLPLQGRVEASSRHRLRLTRPRSTSPEPPCLRTRRPARRSA